MKSFPCYLQLNFLNVFLLLKNIHNIKFTLLNVFKFSGIKHFHIVLQLLPPSISKTFSSSYTETISIQDQLKGALFRHALARSQQGATWPASPPWLSSQELRLLLRVTGLMRIAGGSEGGLTIMTPKKPGPLLYGCLPSSRFT